MTFPMVMRPTARKPGRRLATGGGSGPGKSSVTSPTPTMGTGLGPKWPTDVTLPLNGLTLLYDVSMERLVQTCVVAPVSKIQSVGRKGVLAWCGSRWAGERGAGVMIRPGSEGGGSERCDWK